jgi:hypothetical protein
VPEQPLAGQIHYFLGGHAGGVTELSVPSFGRVAYQDVYPGVNLVYYSTHGQLEYDFVLQPGADPNAIALNVRGARASVDAGGDLVLQTAAGPARPGGLGGSPSGAAGAGNATVRQRQPVVYQDLGGVRQPVSGGYVLDGGQVHFRVGAYDTARPLVIDPILLFSSYYGNDLGADALNDVKVDATGSIVDVTGYTAGFLGFSNLVVARLNFDPNTETVTSLQEYVFGGTGDSFGRALDMDRTDPDTVYVVGDTTAPDFPVTPESTFTPGQRSAVLISLNTDPALYQGGWTYPGSLNWSIVTQGLGQDQGLAVRAAPPLPNGASGGAYFAGLIDQTFQTGTYNFWVSHLSAAGLSGETYLADPATLNGLNSAVSGIDVIANPAPRANDGPNTVVVTGWVFDAQAQTTHPFLARLNDNIDGRTMNGVFQQIVPPPGTGARLVIDPSVPDPTDPTGQLPTLIVTGSVANELGGSDLWLARYGLSGFFLQANFLRYGTFNTGSGIALGGGSIYVAGSTNQDGGLHAYVTLFDPDLIPILPQPSVLGGSVAESGYGIAFDPVSAAVFTVGATASPDFPLVNPIQPVFTGPTDGFVTKLTP